MITCICVLTVPTSTCQDTSNLPGNTKHIPTTLGGLPRLLPLAPRLLDLIPNPRVNSDTENPSLILPVGVGVGVIDVPWWGINTLENRLFS